MLGIWTRTYRIGFKGGWYGSLMCFDKVIKSCKSGTLCISTGCTWKRRLSTVVVAAQCGRDQNGLRGAAEIILCCSRSSVAIIHGSFYSGICNLGWCSRCCPCRWGCLCILQAKGQLSVYRKLCRGNIVVSNFVIKSYGSWHFRIRNTVANQWHYTAFC